MNYYDSLRLSKFYNLFKIDRNNFLYILITNPNIYVYKLLSKTLYIGLITLFLSWVYIHSNFHEVKIPSSMHSLIGIVIGLLLVFRTNTAYDRWWEGRKAIANISNSIGFLMIKFNSSNNGENPENIFKHIISFIDNLKKFLIKNTGKEKDSVIFHKNQLSVIGNIISEIKILEQNNKINGRDATIMEKSLHDLLEFSNICERIKNTPIPIAYALHIKISIFIYLLTLPFGLFYDLGLWSTVMVMIIFYLIAGIEIISSEIEDPFAGEPNDLPVEKLLNNILKTSETLKKNN